MRQLTAFLEGNPFRGRRVQDATRHLQIDVDAWQEQALATWPTDDESFERQLALSNHVEALCRSAQQLAALAESRPSAQVQKELRDAVQKLATPLDQLLAHLRDAAAPAPHNPVAAIEAAKAEFMAWSAGLGRRNPRLFSSCLLAVAAAQRIEEAVEAAAAAAALRAVPTVTA